MSELERLRAALVVADDLTADDAGYYLAVEVELYLESIDAITN